MIYKLLLLLKLFLNYNINGAFSDVIHLHLIQCSVILTMGS